MSKLIINDLTIEKDANGFTIEVIERGDYGSTCAKTHITKELMQKVIEFLFLIKEGNINE